MMMPVDIKPGPYPTRLRHRSACKSLPPPFRTLSQPDVNV